MAHPVNSPKLDALLAAKSDDVAYLLDHGVGLSRILKELAEGHSVRFLADTVRSAVVAGEWSGPGYSDEAGGLCGRLKPLSQFQEEEATWLIPGWLPEGQITLLAADGGIGKTTLWCHLIAALSSGRRCILDPEGFEREPMEVAFLTTEDSVRKKLKRKLSLAGAAMSNIYTVDSAAGGEAFLRSLKFGSEEMEKFVRDSRYKLYVFDPVQGYIPPNLNMGSRNAMRDCLAPLISLGEETGATFLIVAHTNKRKGAFGRDRIADSADLWDISRSVMMAGYTEEQGVRYLSNEKNNYDSLKETLLFSIDGDGQIVPEGTSWKRDREYQQESQFVIAAPKREECTRWLLNRLEAAEGELPVTRLETEATAAGFSRTTLRNAKDALKKDGYIAYRQSYSEGKRQWSLLLLKSPDKEKGAARASAV